MAIGQKMMPGDPLDPKTQMGAMVDEIQTKRVMGYIDAGNKEGAKLRMGGKQVHIDNAGSFIEPTLFDNVDNKMKIAQEEIFGPVLSVIPVKDAEQALSVANDTIYGLASAIFTSDINKAFKFAKGLRAGSVWVNHLRRRRHHHAVRRLQAVGHRPRQVPARLRQVHPGQDDLDPARLNAVN
jgi:acyl-CoA reductase-like NAD-dependent aldehyde dehydrogenase